MGSSSVTARSRSTSTMRWSPLQPHANAGSRVDFICRRCGQPGRRRADGCCARCVVQDRIRALLSERTGVLVPQLRLLAEVLVAADKPYPVLNWLFYNPAATLHADLVTSHVEITHNLLDGLPRRAASATSATSSWPPVYCPADLNTCADWKPGPIRRSTRCPVISNASSARSPNGRSSATYGAAPRRPLHRGVCCPDQLAQHVAVRLFDSDTATIDRAISNLALRPMLTYFLICLKACDAR
jgi:hypothetical protein